MKTVLNYKKVVHRRQRATTARVIHRENCQIFANDSYSRNTMRVSRLTQFVLVTLNVFLTVWFVVVNSDFLETKLKLINQLSIMNKLNFSSAATLLYLL